MRDGSKDDVPITEAGDSGSAQASEAGRRYCSVCGEIFNAALAACPNCATVWQKPARLDTDTMTTLLTDLARLHNAGVLDDGSFERLRRTYEAWLIEIRPPRRVVASQPRVSPVAAETPAVQASLPAASRPPGVSIADWTAKRQADILLYLGAFLLSIAATIVVGYQGDTLSGLGRFGVLLGYTVAFVALGLALPRWQRVREAGAVFLALGALLVPFDFLALRIQVLGAGTLPDSAIWLAGASVTTGLYTLLGLRGFGRFYLLPGAVAALVAWESLGAVLNLPVEWFGAWSAGAAAGLAAVWSSSELPGGRWAEAGAYLIGGGGLLYAHLAAASPPGDAHQLPAAYALATAGAAVLALRRRQFRPAPLPALLALTAISACWSFFRLAPEWYGCFIAVAALGYLALAEIDQARQWPWRLIAAAPAVLALTWAHSAALLSDTRPAQLPLTYAIVLAGAIWDAMRHRGSSLLILPALVASAGSSLLWALGVSPVWWGYPWLAAAAAVLANESWWRGRDVLAKAGWPYLLALAAGPSLIFALAELSPTPPRPPLHGLAIYLVSAAIFLVAALRCRGALASIWISQPGPRSITAERRLLTGTSFAFLFGAAGYLNAIAGLHGGARGWIYVGMGAGIWLLLAIAGGALLELFGVFALAGIAASIVAALTGAHSAGGMTFGLALATAGPAIAFPATRRWALWLIAFTFGAGLIASFWEWQHLARFALPLAYAGGAGLLWGSLMRWRRRGWDERNVVVQLLCWTPWALAIGVALLLAGGRSLALPPGGSLVRTREWTVLALTVALSAMAVLAEGLRLGRTGLSVAGSAGLLLAGLLAIAIEQPANVQAYTLPIGVYLVVLGLLQSRSERLFGAYMTASEAVLVLGLLFLVLPPAEQSFEPGGDRYLFELLAAGLVFLALGFALSVRWLVAGGVLTYTGIAVRALAVLGSHVPYWLTLGVVGMALLLFGMLLLLQRDRWDRARRSIAGWWLGPAAKANLPSGIDQGPAT